MILYIHGFGSSGKGGKSLQFKEYFKSQNIRYIAPSLSYVPELAMDTLEQLINSYDEEIILIGSSLGGFYSIYLAEKYALKAVLINPAVDSSKTLKRVLAFGDRQKNYYDDTRFDWTVEHVDMLLSYRVSKIQNGTYFLLLQTGDDVLDYKEALAKMLDAKSIVEEGGTHPFEGAERYFTQIEAFLTEASFGN